MVDGWEKKVERQRVRDRQIDRQTHRQGKEGEKEMTRTCIITIYVSLNHVCLYMYL